MKNKRILSLLAVLLTVAMAVSFAGNTVPETAKAAVDAGAQILVAGSSVFCTTNRKAAIEALRV